MFTKNYHTQVNILVLFFLAMPILTSCIVKGASPHNGEIKDIKVGEIAEGGIKDIVFYGEHGDFYYINRGLEQGLNLDSLKTKVLNKTVTLHLAELLGGATSYHISQLAIGGEIIYTEFD